MHVRNRRKRLLVPTYQRSRHWTKNRATPQCWWCRYPYQTQEHLFKECPEWKTQQKILWAEVWKETGRWKSRWKIRDPAVPSHARLHGIRRNGLGAGRCSFLCSFLCPPRSLFFLFLCNLLGENHIFLG